MFIKITASHLDESTNEIVDYQNSLYVTNEYACDFHSLYSALKVLYPKATFVNFSLPTKVVEDGDSRNKK